MRCLNCHYSLANLSVHRCPECGREFDPNDPASFETPARRRRISGNLIAALVVLPLIIWIANGIQLKIAGTPLWHEARRPPQFGGQSMGITLWQLVGALLALLWLVCFLRLCWLLRNSKPVSVLSASLR